METNYELLVNIREFLRSYRTYEEWKLVYRKVNKKITTSSYRTYEEWKLWTVVATLAIGGVRSYRTYEEWKLEEAVRIC